MLCPNGHEVVDQPKFCPECGAPLVTAPVSRTQSKTRTLRWGIGGAIVAVAVVGGAVILGHQDTNTVPNDPRYTTTCSLVPGQTITGAGETPGRYEVTVANQSQTAFQVQIIAVAFYDASGSQLGSDTEPGNGYVNGSDAGNDLGIVDGNQSATYDIDLTNLIGPSGIPTGSASCRVLQVQLSN